MLWADSTNSMTPTPITVTSLDFNTVTSPSYGTDDNGFVMVYRTREDMRNDLWRREDERFDAEVRLWRMHYEAVGKSRSMAVSRRWYPPLKPSSWTAVRPVGAVARCGLPPQAPLPVRCFSRAAKRRGRRVKLQRIERHAS